MNTRISSFKGLLIACAGSVQLAMAAEYATALEAHVHGLSELTIAMERDELEIQFTSPVMNLAGFEHKASTKEDIETIESIAAQLRSYKQLFSFPNDRCEHINVSTDVSGLIDSTDHKNGQSNDATEHHHAHEESHKAKESDEHEESHEHGHVAGSRSDSHSDIVVNYTYRCEDTASLSAITVDFFQFFPGIQEIHVMWIKAAQQGSATLTPTNRVIEMGPPL